LKTSDSDDFSPATRNISSLNSTAEDDGCDPNGKIAFVVHGWLESVKASWVPVTVDKLLQYRTGCVYVMDYSKFSVAQYSNLVADFSGLAGVLTKKLQSVTTNYDLVYIFGFSFGTRLSIEAGKRVGAGKIDRMDLCDPSGKRSTDFYFKRAELFLIQAYSPTLLIQSPLQRTSPASTLAGIVERPPTTVTRTSEWASAVTTNRQLD
jgi:Lipase